MEPREIDALVAEKVMGWFNNRKCPEKPGMWGIMDRTEKGPVLAADFPSYSSDIEAAWEVVEKMSERKYTFELKRYTDNTRAEFFDCGKGMGLGNGDAPLAICLAALKAVGVQP